MWQKERNQYEPIKLQTISIVLLPMVYRKYFLLMLLIMGGMNNCLAQVDTVIQPESTRIELPKSSVNTAKKNTDTFQLAQPESVINTDSVARKTVAHDTIALKDSTPGNLVPLITVPRIDTGTYRKYETHPFLPMQALAVYMLINYHREHSKDDLFYLMSGVVLCLAFVRAIFPRYFRNLFVLFFQTSLRQKQTREQLLQDNLASLMINLMYVISFGLYIALLIQYRHWSNASFWLLALGSALVLIFVYLGKYLFLLFTGWVFNTKEAAGTYTFIVFMINKVMGVALIPFLLILSFSSSPVIEVAITVSLFLIGALFLYRYLLSFAAIRNKLKVNALHFFLYLCAVEILPLVLIYKAVFNLIATSI
jgi:hypothetical protein